MSFSENVIGEGGNSVVYRGMLPNEKELAVKVLKPRKEALKEFLSELDILTTLNHKNIMLLQGFCFEDSNIILVYDFVPRGSLEDCIHGVLFFNILPAKLFSLLIAFSKFR